MDGGDRQAVIYEHQKRSAAANLNSSIIVPYILAIDPRLKLLVNAKLKPQN